MSQMARERLRENDFGGAKAAGQAAAVGLYKVVGQQDSIMYHELKTLLNDIQTAEQLRRTHMQAGHVELHVYADSCILIGFKA